MLLLNDTSENTQRNALVPRGALLHQCLALARLQLRLWWRQPKHVLVSIALSIAFLVLGNHVMVIRLGRHMCIGVHTRNPDAARRVEREVHPFNLAVARYDTLAQGRADLAHDRIVGLMSFSSNAPNGVHLIFSGKNPLVDRELAAVLLRVAAHVTTDATQRAGITMENNRYTPRVMTTFMTAGLLPFLILALASVNLGLFWLCDYERGTLYTLLSTPVSRGVLIAGRTAGGLVAMLVTFSVTLVICRQFVHWEMGGHPLVWCAIMLLQMLTMCGCFFTLAMVCRRFALYTDVGLILALVLAFLSGAFTPVQTMPGWARVFAALTPTLYAVRLTRAVMLGAEPILVRDLSALALWAIAGFAFGYWRLTVATVDRRA